MGFRGFDLAIEVGEGMFKDLTQARIVGVLQLLEDPLARELKPFQLSDPYRFLGGDLSSGRLLPNSCLGLLFFQLGPVVAFDAARNAAAAPSF